MKSPQAIKKQGGAIMKVKRGKKSLTKAEYVRYLEALKTNSLAVLMEGL
jgi:hypothetical protein